MCAQMIRVDMPVDMLLFCPGCHEQHIDAPAQCSMGVGCREAGVCYAAYNGEPDRCDAWTNPPHRSHLCIACGCVWRPADTPPTNGVKDIKTKGQRDTELPLALWYEPQP